MSMHLTPRLPGSENLQCTLHGETPVALPWKADHRSGRRGQRGIGTPVTVGNQGVEDRAQFECCPTDPVSKCGTVKIDALAAHDLGPPVERQMIGVFGHQHMRDSRFRRQSGLDQPHGRWSLGNSVGAGTHAYLGRRVTMTRNCAGMTSNRSDTSSPMQCKPPPQGQISLSGPMISSMRGRWAGREPRLAERGLVRGLSEGLSASS